MPYRVVLILKSGEHVADDAWTSPHRTAVIGEVIELPFKARVVRAIVRGIARPPTDTPEADSHSDLVIAREI
jgi:hypothetical protein